MQGKTLTKCGIAKAYYPTDADKTMADFTEDIQLYLERVVGVTYLSSFIIRIICTNKKPALVSIEDHLARQNELERQLNGPYLLHNLALPTLHEKAEQIFDHQPKQHQSKYAETNEEVETDETILKTFLEGFHIVDVTSGDYKNIVNGVNAAM